MSFRFTSLLGPARRTTRCSTMRDPRDEPSSRRTCATFARSLSRSLRRRQPRGPRLHDREAVAAKRSRSSHHWDRRDAQLDPRPARRHRDLALRRTISEGLLNPPNAAQLRPVQCGTSPNTSPKHRKDLQIIYLAPARQAGGHWFEPSSAHHRNTRKHAISTSESRPRKGPHSLAERIWNGSGTVGEGRDGEPNTLREALTSRATRA